MAWHGSWRAPNGRRYRMGPEGTYKEIACAKTIRKTLLAMPGRLTRSARRWTLHLPRGWPWARWFTMALAQLRCIPFPA